MPCCLCNDHARGTGAPQARAIDTISFPADANSKPRPQPTLSRLERLSRASGFHRTTGRQPLRRHLQRRSAEALAILAILKQLLQNSVTCQRAVLVLFWTQHKTTFFCLLSTQKNAVSLSLAAQARAWNSLLTVSATLRLLCARRSGLAERRPERRPQTTKPQVPGIKASGKLEVRVCVVCTSTMCMHTRNYTCLLSLSL